MTQQVLVLDAQDNRWQQRVRALQAQGYDVRSTPDFADALSQLEEDPNLVVVCDCQHSHLHAAPGSTGASPATAGAGRVRKTEPATEHGLEIDATTYRVSLNGRQLPCSATEFRLLSVLVQQAPRVVPSEDILSEVWGAEYREDPGILRIYIHTLRQKLRKAGGDGGWIRNVPTVGYSFDGAGDGDGIRGTATASGTLTER